MTDDWTGFVEVPGGRLWTEAAGSGSGVVLIHAGVADARMWDPQWEALAARHRVVRYDTRGFGRTETRDVEFSNRADVLAVMDAAGLPSAVLVGASRGGSIALDTALEFPDRADGLVWSCGGISGFDAEDSPQAVELAERGEALLEARDWAGAADIDVALWVDGAGQPAGRAPAAARELVRRMCLETYEQDKPFGRPIVLSPPAVERLGSLTVPMLAIVGELDVASIHAAADLLERDVQQVRRVTVHGVAHLPSLERPDWFTDTLLAFAAEVHAAAGR